MHVDIDEPGYQPGPGRVYPLFSGQGPEASGDPGEDSVAYADILLLEALPEDVEDPGPLDDHRDSANR